MATEIRGSRPDSKLNVPASCLRLITQFAYEGPSNCELSEDCLQEVIDMSNEFQIEKLLELSGRFLEDHVNGENFKKFLNMAELLPTNDCKNKIVEFIALNIKNLKDADILSLEKKQFLILMKHECLNLTKEEAAALTKNWVDNNRITRSENKELQIASEAETASRIPAVVILAVGGQEKEARGQSEMYNP